MTHKRSSLAYVVNSLDPGGTEKLVVEMSLAFSEEFDVVVICLDAPGLWTRDLRSRGVPVHCVWRQPGLDLSIPVKLAELFRHLQIDIVHAHQCTAWFYAALARLRYGAPRLLLEEHGRFFPEEDKPGRRLFNRVVTRRLTHGFVAVSRDIRERLCRYEGLDMRTIEVVHNGVREGPPVSLTEREAYRRDLGFTPECFVVGTVGRFDRIKNLSMLIDSLATAVGDLPQIRGLLVGDGPQFAEIRAQVQRCGLQGRVVLTGFRSDARQLIACMDLFVLSSVSEGASMALLEAMMAGVAVAVTDVGGNPELVARGATGWIVPSGSSHSLAAAIREAVCDPVRRREYGAAGRRRFQESFLFETMIASYRRTYHRMLSTRPLGRAPSVRPAP